MTEEIDAVVPSVLADAPGVVAAFSRRHGGVSTGVYRSLNLGLSTGDDPTYVSENRRRALARFGLDAGRLAVAGQVHGERIKVVTEPGLYPGFDALVTGSSGVVLANTAADCAILLLADADARVVAACHSGWRGTLAGIAKKTIDAMCGLGADPSNILAYVSPSICAEHFEVGPEVAARFEEWYVLRRPERPHVDLKRAIRDQLLDAGLPPAGVQISERCTVSETGDFFSYRAERGTTGRMMGFICLNSL